MASKELEEYKKNRAFKKIQIIIFIFICLSSFSSGVLLAYRVALLGPASVYDFIIVNSIISVISILFFIVSSLTINKNEYKYNLIASKYYLFEANNIKKKQEEKIASIKKKLKNV